MLRSLRVGGRSSQQNPKYARRVFVSVDEAANRSRGSEAAAAFFAAAFCFVFFEPKETQPRMARQRRLSREEDQKERPQQRRRPAEKKTSREEDQGGHGPAGRYYLGRCVV